MWRGSGDYIRLNQSSQSPECVGESGVASVCLWFFFRLIVFFQGAFQISGRERARFFVLG
ncbi:hypothetical protein D3C86_2015650 [compost metagenome]